MSRASRKGILAGIGFALVGVERIWLLAVCTTMFSLIPFLGAAIVWVCVTVVLLFEQRYGAAGFLAVYGAVVISGSDNVVKAQVLRGRAQMHPLIAFVSVLGGLQLVGLWGIFLGPITAAFFYAMLKILNKKLLGTVPKPTPYDTLSATSSAPTHLRRVPGR